MARLRRTSMFIKENKEELIFNNSVGYPKTWLIKVGQDRLKLVNNFALVQVAFYIDEYLYIEFCPREIYYAVFVAAIDCW